MKTFKRNRMTGSAVNVVLLLIAATGPLQLSVISDNYSYLRRQIKFPDIRQRQ